MSSAIQLSDFEAIIDAAFDEVGFDRCLLIGKAWAGPSVVQLAAETAVGERVEAIVLVAPSSVVPGACETLSVPVLLFWAEDDDVSPFDDRHDWLEALDNRSAPTTLVFSERGGHRLDVLLSQEGAAEGIYRFTVSALLLGNLLEEEHLEEQRIDSDDDEDPRVKATKSRSSRLIAELPGFLRQDVECCEFRDGEPVPEAWHVRSGMDTERRIKKRLCMDLPHWIQGGMLTASE